MTTGLAAAALAAAGAWSTIAQNVATESTGISFNADGKTGYLAGGTNGVGADAQKSTDGGLTWTATNDPAGLLYLDVTSYGNNVAVTGTLSAIYSNDGGVTFGSSAGYGAVAQCVRNFGPHDTPAGFAFVGSDFNNSNVVGVSTDDGASYTQSVITSLTTDARYGAFPSTSVWYISAGTWPNNANALRGAKRGGKAAAGHKAGARAAAKPTGFYNAEIAVTTDGGATFNTVFSRQHWAYLNGIDCLDTTRCCVAAENDNADGFAAVLCTFDSGATWNQTLLVNTTGASMLDLRVVGTDGYWAVGGVMGSFGPSEAFFYYSGDAGMTWTQDSTISGYYVTSVDCAQGTQECWATMLDALQSASVAYASTI